MRRFWRQCSVVIVAFVAACQFKEQLLLDPVTFDALPFWETGDHRAALSAYQTSCTKKAKQQTNLSNACEHALMMHTSTKKQAGTFFEEYFVPHRMRSSLGITPLLTGYYIPTLNASRTQTPTFRWPAYALPEECDGKQCFSRTEIDGGVLSGRGLELLWFDDQVMLFFAHIQGSATVAFEDGSRAMLRYAGHNGHDYVAVGRWLIDEDEVAKEDMSLNAIRDWMHANPDKQHGLMQRNPRYIFFSLDEEKPDAVGAEGTALTPHYSLAVDPEFMSYGSLVFTALEGTEAHPQWHQLMVAQDTGSAIKGPLRGDIFFGYGEEAERLASDWQQSGVMYLLVEKVSRDEAAGE